MTGGGPGGTPAAMALASAGKNVLLVEAGRGLGGTCLFEGCIPSKIFRETAARRQAVGRAGAFGLATPEGSLPDIDWAAVQSRRHKILTGRAQGALANAKSLPSLEVVFARARLTGPSAALIETPQAQRPVTFDHAILATGSVPDTLPIPGADLPGVLDSNQLIEIGFIPRSMVLIGGGPIGVEMAQIFSMLGASVTILEVADRILGPVDTVLAARLASRLEQDGIAVHTGARVASITDDEGRHEVTFSVDGKETVAEAEVVAIVAGRHPGVAGLGLEATKIRHDRHGIKVDATLQVEGAADLMGEAALAVRLGLTTRDLASAIHPRPTLTEAFGVAALLAQR